MKKKKNNNRRQHDEGVVSVYIVYIFWHYEVLLIYESFSRSASFKIFECKKIIANKHLTICHLALQISKILEDIGCYLPSQGTENIYEPTKNVEVNLFEDIELKVIMNISEVISCSWFFKESQPCKPSLDSENR